MFEFVLGIVVGLFVGWILLPEPAWVRDLWARLGWARPV
jgi:hypothetical protein